MSVKRYFALLFSSFGRVLDTGGVIPDDAKRAFHHPCMASMEVDPELSDTLMHLSGYIFRAAINAGLRRK